MECYIGFVVVAVVVLVALVLNLKARGRASVKRRARAAVVGCGGCVFYLDGRCISGEARHAGWPVFADDTRRAAACRAFKEKKELV